MVRARRNSHVAAYLRTYDLTLFNPKAPPPKTQAFWDMVNSARPGEAAELTDLLEEMGWPEAVSRSQLSVPRATTSGCG